jgi:PGF-CTERM protein
MVRGGNDTATETVAVGAATVTADAPSVTPTAGPGNEASVSPGEGTERATGTSAPPLPGFGPLAAVIAVLLVAVLARSRR